MPRPTISRPPEPLSWPGPWPGYPLTASLNPRRRSQGRVCSSLAIWAALALSRDIRSSAAGPGVSAGVPFARGWAAGVSVWGAGVSTGVAACCFAATTSENSGRPVCGSRTMVREAFGFGGVYSSMPPAKGLFSPVASRRLGWFGSRFPGEGFIFRSGVEFGRRFGNAFLPLSQHHRHRLPRLFPTYGIRRTAAPWRVQYRGCPRLPDSGQPLSRHR